MKKAVGSNPKKQKPIGTTEEEAALCRKAFAKSKVGDLVWHCHHGQGIEILTESAENRIRFILTEKAAHERPRRLRYFRPIKLALLPKSLQKAYSDWQKAYSDRQKAYSDRQKAYAAWQKADADRQKADAAWQKAYAAWQKADADRQKADAAWQKADAAWQKADADWQKADAAWQKADADWQKAKAFADFHAATCGCPFGPTKNIFGNLR